MTYLTATCLKCGEPARSSEDPMCGECFMDRLQKFEPRLHDKIAETNELYAHRKTADEPNLWRVIPQTVVGKVTKVQHVIHLDYGNDAGPNSDQSATVHVITRAPGSD